MSEYADWLEQWATTEDMGVLEEFCEVDPPDEQQEEWSPDEWQYWCRCRGKRTATELLRIWEVLP